MSKKGPALYELIQQQAQRNRPTSVVTRPAAPTKSSTSAARPAVVEPPAPPTKQPVPFPQPKPVQQVAPAEPTVAKPSPAQTSTDAPPPSAHSGSWLFQGKAYRVPAGYIVMAAFLLIAFTIGAYSIGVTVTKNREEAANDAEHIAQLAKNDPTHAANRAMPQTNPTNNPAQSRPNPGTSNPQQSEIPPRNVPIAGANRQIDLSAQAPQKTASRPAIAGIKLDPGDTDPRLTNLNYFVLASYLQQEEADKAVDFFAANGVAAMRLAPNNRGLCTLVALEGFPPGETRSDLAREYQASLLKLGREYKRNHRGGTDFSDLYLKKHKP